MIRMKILTAAVLILISALQMADTAAQDSLSIYTEEVPPDQYVDKNGNLTGFSVDVVKDIQRRIGDGNTIRVALWANAYREIRLKPNVVLFSMVRTPEREHLFKWVGPLLTFRTILIARSDSKLSVKSVSDAKKIKLIGTVKDDYRDAFLRDLGFTNLDAIAYSNQNMKRLMTGRIDAFVLADIALAGTLQSTGFKKSDVKEVFSFREDTTYIAFSKTTPDYIIEKWNAGYREAVKDGTVQKLKYKWFMQK